MTVLRPAEKLLMELGITRPGEIDLEAIAWTLGAAVRFRPLDESEATIIGSKQRAIITVNCNSLPVRQRFSLGHEIGHWHHHKGRVLFCGARDIGNPAHRSLNPEYQADQFASDLILPGYMFRPKIAKMKRLTLSHIGEIADEFRASRTATLLKLIDSDRFPIIAVCHGKEKRSWFHRAPMIPNWWFPNKELDHESFAFELLFGGASEGNYPRKIGADAWFDFRGADRYEVWEQSFLLPGHEVLTMLILPEEGLD